MCSRANAILRGGQWADKAARDVDAATRKGRARAAREQRMAYIRTLTNAELGDLVLDAVDDYFDHACDEHAPERDHRGPATYSR